MELWHFVNPGFIKYVFSFHWIFLEYILLMMLRYVLVVWLISCVLWTWEDCWVGIGQEMSQRRGCDTVSVAGCWLRGVVPAHLNNPCHLISPPKPHSLFKVPFIIEDVPQRQVLGLITSEIRNDNVLCVSVLENHLSIEERRLKCSESEVSSWQEKVENTTFSIHNNN